MILASDLLLEIRSSLHDLQEKRWSNDRLILLINEAARDIALRTRYLRKYINITLVENKLIYDLPDNCFMIHRAFLDGKPVDFYSFAEYSLKAIPDSIIYDKQNNTVRINFEVSNSTKQFEITPGVGIESVGTCFAVQDSTGLWAVFDALEVDDDGNGLIGSIKLVLPNLLIFYYAYPDKIITTADKLDIPAVYNKAIRHYVLSQAWKDDMDSANLNLSEIEFKYYINELSYIAKLSSLDNTLGQQYRPIYNTVFDF